ncbi:MAG: ABC transporter ATP-binding protein/permease [Clostridium sp.]|jgi:ABC-type multidrug transport system fused ATPase/permease subunit|nr:ABC transporter ATP-binding protein/permease [Clostridium sp.]
MDKKHRSLLKRYLKEICLTQNRKPFALVFLLSLLKVGVVLVPPVYIMKIMDHAIPRNDPGKILFYIGVILAFTVSDAGIGIALARLYSLLRKRVYLFYQKKCIDHMFRLGGSYFSSMSTGNGFTTMMSDVSEVRNLVSPALFTFAADAITALAMFGFLASIQADLIVVVLCLLPVIYLCQSYFQKKGRKKAEEVRESYGTLTGAMENMVSNTLLCILCNGAGYFRERYHASVEKATDQEMEMQMVFAKNSGVLTFLATLFTILILGFGGMKVLQGSLTIGGLVAFNMYAQKLAVPLLKISNVLLMFQSTFVSMERVEAFLEEPEVPEREHALASGIREGGNLLAFQEVGFSYGNKTDVLKEVTASFRPGIIHAVVGGSGSGKSTLVSLLYRVWDAQKGQITINGHSSRDFSLRYLRSRIAVVGQESYLFDDTVMNNLVMGEDVTKERVFECARTAQIHDYIMSLPTGYDSMAGERGVKLSGGEKQRICLARALIRNTPILILDEATSALDQLTEKRILDRLADETSGRILIMITHRLQSVMRAEAIHVLKDGRMEAAGTHEELMAGSPYYKTIFERGLAAEKSEG